MAGAVVARCRRRRSRERRRPEGAWLSMLRTETSRDPRGSLTASRRRSARARARDPRSAGCVPRPDGRSPRRDRCTSARTSARSRTASGCSGSAASCSCSSPTDQVLTDRASPRFVVRKPTCEDDAVVSYQPDPRPSLPRSPTARAPRPPRKTTSTGSYTTSGDATRSSARRCPSLLASNVPAAKVFLRSAMLFARALKSENWGVSCVDSVARCAEALSCL